MPFHRILILQSVDDRITRRRIKYIEENSALKDFVFEHCYAMQVPETSKTLLINLMMQNLFEDELDANHLQNRLVDQITKFQPDLIVVFYGAILHHYAESFMSVMQSLKQTFPQLVIAAAHPQIAFEQVPHADSVFDNDPETLALVNKIFPTTLSMGIGNHFSQN